MKVRVAATLVSDNGNHYSIGIEAEKDRHEKGPAMMSVSIEDKEAFNLPIDAVDSLIELIQAFEDTLK